MKIFKLFMLFLVATFAFKGTMAQDASINILAGGSGIVTVGGSIFLQVDVTNNDATGVIVANKVRPQISAPTGISSISLVAADHTLPSGWTIASNTGSVIRFTNTTDPIPAGVTRTALIKINGGPSIGSGTILANLTFVGAAPSGDNPANNSSSAGLTVNAAAACTLGVSAGAGTIACNGGTTSLTATPSGAAGAVEYSITGGAPFQASNVFTVPAGTYTVTAREVATPGCTATSSSVVVSQPTAVSANAAVSTPIAILGGTGAITVSALGGTGTKTYVITSGTTINTTGATTGVFTGLLAGSYSFTATDANNCTGVASVTLNNPAACLLTGVSAIPGTILCNGGTTTLTATPAGAGVGAVEYSLTGGAPFQASNVFTNIAAGSYTVTAREVANIGCTATSSVVSVTQPVVLGASGSVSTPIAIQGGAGAITVNTTGGTGASTYVITSGTTINTTGVTSGIFTGLLAGNYVFTATDANGCTAVSAAVVLANPGVATADPAVGQMFFTTTSGGTQSANSLLMAPATDLYDINVPFYNLNQSDVVPNGTIRFTVNLGRKLELAPGFNLATAPLSNYFTWSQADVAGNVILTGTQIAAIPADFDNVAIFRVKGDSACRSNVVANIVITNQLQTLADDDLQNNAATLQYTLPITLTNTKVNVTCNTAGNGIINIVASSGTTVVTTGPGGYTNTTGLASGVNNFSLSGLLPGTYNITASASSVSPLAACSQTISVIITEPTTLTIPAASISKTNITCFGTATGSITVTAAGGTAPYTYTIAGPTVNATGATSGIFTGLLAGSYTVTATDNNGCTATTAAIIITQPVGNIPDITLGSDFTGNFFTTPGVSQTIVYNIAEIAGNSAVGDTLRITKPAGFTITFNPTIFSTTVGATTYTLDNPRWKIDNSNPAFTSIILTDPLNATNPGTILCNQLVRVAVTLTRNTSNISTFTLSARLRRANGELNLANNLNSIIMTAE